MMIKYLSEPFSHVIIKDYYTKTELVEIYEELSALNYWMMGPETTEASKTDGKFNKRGKGVFIDDLTEMKVRSKIFQYSRKIFTREFMDALQKNLPYKETYFRLFTKMNSDSTLVQYYGEGDYYKPHFDLSIFSAVTPIYKTPKKFKGGDLIFNQYKYDPQLESNDMIIFPSVIFHEVTEIKNLKCKFGRYSITHFLQNIVQGGSKSGG